MPFYPDFKFVVINNLLFYYFKRKEGETRLAKRIFLPFNHYVIQKKIF